MSGKYLSIEKRQLILKLHGKDGKSYAEIAALVDSPRSTVQTVINRFQYEGRVKNKIKSGRPPALSHGDKLKIKRMVATDPFISASKICGQIALWSQKRVHPETVRRAIADAGYKSRTPRRKPLVCLRNRKKRLDFARQYKNASKEFWRKVIFSDESKYNIFGSDGRIRVWRKPGEAYNPNNTIKTVKHGGGGVMVWGCMAASGVGNLEILNGVMDHKYYIDILKRNLVPSAEKLGLASDYYFVQDNDPKHTALNTRMYLLFNTPHFLKTPPQSPDLNPIEHMWDRLEKKIRSRIITSKPMLIQALQEEWAKTKESYTQHLVNSMPDRLKAVIKNKGYPTKY